MITRTARRRNRHNRIGAANWRHNIKAARLRHRINKAKGGVVQRGKSGRFVSLRTLQAKLVALFSI